MRPDALFHLRNPAGARGVKPSAADTGHAPIVYRLRR